MTTVPVLFHANVNACYIFKRLYLASPSCLGLASKGYDSTKSFFTSGQLPPSIEYDIHNITINDALTLTQFIIIHYNWKHLF
jgi:hypothetical protein